jgi:hypothetical protein
MTPDWRYPVNQLLYGLTYSSDIDEEIVNFNASSAVDYTTLNLGPEVYSRAIRQALASGEHLDSLSLLPQFDQAQLTDFLRAVSARLDQLRPWPQPEVRPLAPKPGPDSAMQCRSLSSTPPSYVELGVRPETCHTPRPHCRHARSRPAAGVRRLRSAVHPVV